MASSRFRAWTGALTLALLASHVARADTHIVTFAGGPDPAYDQESLEQNVLYLRRTLGVLGLDKVKHEEFFADGGTSAHAVEVHVQRSEQEQVTDAIAQLLNEDAERDVRFRAAAVPGAGAATLASLDNWFDTQGKNLPPHSRLVFYFTGHGGTLQIAANGGGRGNAARGRRRPPTIDDPRNTTMLLWNSPELSAADFEKQLDKLDPTVDVTLIMVQCHAGGFANVIYPDIDPKKGVAKQLRCGFFASTAARPAAGCTPDINRADYEEFSTGFFAALSGVTRDGKKIDKPDYDGDGVTSLADAFMYVVLTSNTIDTPMTTSDLFLRDKAAIPDNPRGGLLGRDASYHDLLAAADKLHAAGLEGLSKVCGLTEDDRLAQARQQSAQIDRQRSDLQRQRDQAARDLAPVADGLRAAVSTKWPELGAPWHPEAEKVLEAEAPDIESYLQKRNGFPLYQSLSQKEDQLDAQDDQLERKWVKLQRFIAQAETVILAHNLQKSGPADQWELYKDLVGRENRPLN